MKTPISLRIRVNPLMLVLAFGLMLLMPPAVANAAETSVTPRPTLELGGEWRFTGSDTLTGAEAVAFDDSRWEKVTVPHTWQSLAAWTDYSHAWYRTHFHGPAGGAGRRHYLQFDAAGITAEVFLNGVRLGRHVGPYTAFVFDATDHLRPDGDNVLAVRVDNKTDIVGNLSKATDGKVFKYWCIAAGLYRPVRLFSTDAIHISPLDHGSSGVYLSESNLTNGGADVAVTTVLRNASETSQRLTVRHVISAASGKVVGELSGEATVAAGSEATVRVTGRVEGVEYWTPATPRLYTVRSEVLVAGKVRDTVVQRTGFRTVGFENGMITLNGRPFRLIGAALHSRSERGFHVITTEEIRRDLEELKAVGYNSAFYAHYPHAQAAYDLADELGLLVWAENGFVNGSYEPTVSAGITREMVRQYYNHPSIFCWSASNEPYAPAFAATSALLGVIRAEKDPRRVITYNNMVNVDFSDPQADFWTKSLMPGWYSNQGEPWEKKFPSNNQAGAGAAITHQASYEARKFKISDFEPEGYQLYLAEVITKRAYEDREYFLHFWWQLKDVDAANFRGILNSKGLMTFAGYKKDIYYLYQSCLRTDLDVIHLCGKHWFLRGEEGNALKVYSNRPELRLRVNGRDGGARLNGHDYQVDGRAIRNVFYWKDVLAPGRNEIEVTDGARVETAVIHYAPGHAMPADPGALVTDLASSRGPAWAVARLPEEQWPVYAQFDGTSCNTFDRLPAPLRGRGTWIATQRQSDEKQGTDLAFTIAPNATVGVDVWVMITRQAQPPAWLTAAGFTDSGLTGQWRDSRPILTDCQWFKKTCRPGERIDLRGGTAGTDWVVFVTPK